MAEIAFPSVRFAEQGASDAEIAQLDGEFQRSDIVAQMALDEHYRSISNGDIRDRLAELRASGYFDAPEQSKKASKKASAPAVAPDAPEADETPSEPQPGAPMDITTGSEQTDATLQETLSATPSIEGADTPEE